MNFDQQPVISNQELISQLKNLKIYIIGEKELTDSDQLDSIYSQFLKLVFGKSNEEMTDHSEIGLQNINTETDMDGVSKQHFLDNINQMMLLVGVKDFSISDIIKSELKRTKKIINLLIQFVSYKQQQFQRFSRDLELNKELESKNTQIRLEIDKANENLQKLKYRKELEKEQCNLKLKQLDGLDEKLKNQFIEKQKQYDKLQATISQYNEKNMKFENNQNDHQVLKSEIFELKSKIVSSPNKIIQRSDAQEKEMENYRENIDQIKGQIQINLFSENCINQFIEQFTQLCKNSQQDWLFQKTTKDQVINQQVQVKKRKDELEIRYEEIQDQINTTMLDIENQNQTKIQYIQKIEKFTKESEDSQEIIFKYQEAEMIHNQLQKQILDLQNSLEQSRKKKLEIQNENYQIIQKAEKYQQNLIEQFKQYRNNIKLAIQHE